MFFYIYIYIYIFIFIFMFIYIYVYIYIYICYVFIFYCLGRPRSCRNRTRLGSRSAPVSPDSNGKACQETAVRVLGFRRLR